MPRFVNSAAPATPAAIDLTADAWTRLAEISPRSRRDVAEISPKSRRDVAEMSPRCRRDVAEIGLTAAARDNGIELLLWPCSAARGGRSVGAGVTQLAVGHARLEDL